eukprot:m.502186 g.502186  ORF g.502186 m.502186 type:complete len:60 (+) comp66990_c0_seq1:105-284(+)
MLLCVVLLVWVCLVWCAVLMVHASCCNMWRLPAAAGLAGVGFSKLLFVFCILLLHSRMN